ncbi:MAG TPA: RNA polymerase sigma factor [Ktedonobacterales bacterium]|nr:RNA polymerase sigma factor [Ktedonobacterales bacterium]
MNDPDNRPPRPDSNATSGPSDEMALLDALRRGDETAFLALVTMHYAAMLRLAQMYVGSRAVAEEVIQETWLGVLQGLDRFEGRSSLKTWIFRILLNRARTRAQRENRTIPFSALATATEQDEPAVEPEVFAPPGALYPGGWLTAPAGWDALPEERLLSRETRAHIDAALTTLPMAQREVITLRDIDGWSAGEVCDYLGISEANQRVLLHRARSRVRQALASYLAS